MGFTFRQLHYFLVLAEELHFGRAAQKLNMSQPPLSASLRQLEDGLGVQLFERNSRGVRLTPAGVAFVERITPALNQLHEAEQAVRLIAKGTIGTLRIGFVPSMIFRGLPQLLANFRVRNPLIQLELLELNSAEQIERLERCQIDVGFIHASPLPGGIATTSLVDEWFVCCVSRQHRLASRQRISLEELSGETVIVFSREHAAHYHDRIVGLLRDADVEAYHGYNLRHWFTILTLIGQGMGVSLVPQCLARAGIENVVFIELAERRARHQASCIWREVDTSHAQVGFLSMVKDFFQLALQDNKDG